MSYHYGYASHFPDPLQRRLQAWVCQDARLAKESDSDQIPPELIPKSASFSSWMRNHREEIEFLYPQAQKHKPKQ